MGERLAAEAAENAAGLDLTRSGEADPQQEPPRRFQLSRVKGTRKPKEAVTVSRPSKWGNPWKAEVVDGVGWCCTDTRTGLLVQARDRADAHDLAVAHYRTWIAPRAAEARAELRGKDLACWCPHGVACHADVLLEIANFDVWWQRLKKAATEQDFPLNDSEPEAYRPYWEDGDTPEAVLAEEASYA